MNKYKVHLGSKIIYKIGKRSRNQAEAEAVAVADDRAAVLEAQLTAEETFGQKEEVFGRAVTGMKIYGHINRVGFQELS